MKKVLAHELKKNPDYNFKEKEGIKHTSTITDIKSEPIIQTNIEDVMISEARAKFNTVINTKTDIKDSILNDKYSNLSKENILKQALTCIKGPRIVIPNSNFIQVKDLEECHINKEEMKHATRLFEMERNFEKIKKNSEDLVITHINKTISAEKKIFDEMMSKANEGIQRMEQGGLVSEEVLAYIKSKVDEDFSKECIKLGISKLNIFENNLDDIKKELEKYETADQECMRLQERLRILEENTKLADLKAEKFIEEKTKQAEDEKSFVINDKIIDKLYQRYKPKPKNKKLNLYNDNPFNYNYNYGRNKYSASKVIQPATKINSRFK